MAAAVELRPKRLKEIEPEIAERRAKVGQSLKAFEEARADLSDTLSEQLWYSELDRRTNWQVPEELSWLKGLRAPNGGPYGWTYVIEALREYGKEPEGAESPDGHPLRAVPKAA